MRSARNSNGCSENCVAWPGSNEFPHWVRLSRQTALERASAHNGSAKYAPTCRVGCHTVARRRLTAKIVVTGRYRKIRT